MVHLITAIVIGVIKTHCLKPDTCVLEPRGATATVWLARATVVTVPLTLHPITCPVGVLGGKINGQSTLLFVGGSKSFLDGLETSAYIRSLY